MIFPAVFSALMSFLGALGVQWIMRLAWGAKPSYWNAYLAFFLANTVGVYWALTSFPLVIAIVLYFFVYVFVIGLRGDERQLFNRKSLARGALLAVAHLVLTMVLIFGFDLFILP